MARIGLVQLDLDFIPEGSALAGTPARRLASDRPASRRINDVASQSMPTHGILRSRSVRRLTLKESGERQIAAALLYNDNLCPYNMAMNEAHVMTVSRNGQVSIPAEARARWNTRRVVVVDLGDRVVMRPLSDHPVDDLKGKYRGRGPTTDRARKEARAEEARRAKSRSRFSTPLRFWLTSRESKPRVRFGRCSTSRTRR